MLFNNIAFVSCNCVLSIFVIVFGFGYARLQYLYVYLLQYLYMYLYLYRSSLKWGVCYHCCLFLFDNHDKTCSLSVNFSPSAQTWSCWSGIWKEEQFKNGSVSWSYWRWFINNDESTSNKCLSKYSEASKCRKDLLESSIMNEWIIWSHWRWFINNKWMNNLKLVKVIYQ